MGEGVRLQKFLSRAGRASRRQAERLMVEGRVTVNGEVANELGARIDPRHDTVAVDGVVIRPRETRWVAFHKPPGVLTTRADPHGGRTVYDACPEARGLSYVGRLDRDTGGLLLFTNEGDLAHALLHPSRGVERQYHAWVTGVPRRGTLDRLIRGVELEDGLARARDARVVATSRDGAEVVLVLTEGRKREVRRLMEAVGHGVRRLVRTRFGPIVLGDLPEGAWRPLDHNEIRRLRALAPDAGE